MTRIALSFGALALCLAAVPAVAQNGNAAGKGNGASNSNSSASPNGTPAIQASQAPSGVPATLFDSFRDPRAKDVPLAVDLSVGISFSRMAFTGRGTGGATLDARTGAKHVFGAMTDLGGPSVQGRGVITGTPSRRVNVVMPARVTMTGRGGLTATLSDFVTDLPPFPVIGADGRLEFAFGARLTMDGPVGSVLRGRVPISVDYD